ncbi:MauE/DoxX family redox-associated membrane protein [Streptomyces albireticuli]|uniref:Methylamine utilization protein MauE n=1 Tax=Streptomyces albireticuli TaxID=1940 RepID=A0A2A2DFM1_9ACTN|nr:MauE/DoxX family redox-associated membrane protein [Streptomyces albireticuli]MCD9194405.1 methylamine utilization protein MauE [Streptomyces albireticuli]PAU50325.1 methylamine utilization protein MauE [Streptomyces albireticuli]
MGYLALGIRCLIGAVFLASAVSKVGGRGAFGRFVSSVRDLRLVPPRSAAPVALCVVAAEAAVCLLLAAPGPGAVAVAGFAVAGVLLGGFAAAVTLSVRRGVRTPCRCFGASTRPLGLRHVVRNLALTAAASAGAAAVLVSGAVRPDAPGGVVVAVTGGLLLGGLVVTLDDILDLFRPVGPAPGLARGR